MSSSLKDDGNHAAAAMLLPSVAKPADAMLAAAMPKTDGSVSATSMSMSMSVATTELVATPTTTTTSSNPKKRVFTFQKRWLHSLPIMEKTLAEAANSMDPTLAKTETGDATSDATASPATAAPRDVIACMLCEDPGASREVFVKTWSRTNCRRGRIENHLMSKHPEFMLLLKQKRDAEGDLAVQIFLQNMREGRCNYRSEISTGLYSHLQHPVAVTSSTLALEQFAQATKRPFPADELLAASATAVNSGKGPVFQQLLGSGTGPRDAAEAALEQEAKRKKAKTGASSPSNDRPHGLDGISSASSGGTLAESATSQLSSPFGIAASPMAQWRSALASKVIVVTGADHPIMAHAATQLWMLGANLLVTFANADAMRAFDAEHMARMQSAEEGDGTPRGTIVPLWCPFHTRAQAQEWSAAIATRFAQVHALINFTTDENIPTALAVTEAGERDTQEQEAFISNTQRLLELCQAFVSTCLHKSGPGSVINVATQANDTRSSMTCAAIEALTKSLAADLASTPVSVNCVLCQPSPKTVTSLSNPDSFDLANLLLFLLAPESASISGSVLCLRSSTSPAAGSVSTTAPPSAPPESLPPAASVV